MNIPHFDLQSDNGKVFFSFRGAKPHAWLSGGSPNLAESRKAGGGFLGFFSYCLKVTTTAVCIQWKQTSNKPKTVRLEKMTVCAVCTRPNQFLACVEVREIFVIWYSAGMVWKGVHPVDEGTYRRPSASQRMMYRQKPWFHSQGRHLRGRGSYHDSCESLYM